MAMEEESNEEQTPPPSTPPPCPPELPPPPAKAEGSNHDFEIDENLNQLLLPDVASLLPSPPSAVDSNFVTYFVVDFMKPKHDQYVRRHANGLCVIGLAATHVAFSELGGVTSVDFNVGKSDRSEMMATGKRKRVLHKRLSIGNE